LHRIDVPSASPTLPTFAAPGSGGYFTAGNPLTAVDATIVDQDWANMVQEELAAVVLGAGLTLTKGNTAQLLQALRTTIGKNIQVFGANGSFTVPPSVTRLHIMLWAGGGGGGGSTGSPSAASGGGGGGYVEGIFTVTPGQVIPMTVGAVGTGGTGATDGTDGGASSAGTLCSAVGGGRGRGTSSAFQGSFGAPGSAVGGVIIAGPQSGGTGTGIGSVGFGGFGGASFCCAGGPGSVGIGGNGQAPGGGGGGGANGAPGSAGGQGFIIVKW
jgi:hypothetical protein